MPNIRDEIREKRKSKNTIRRRNWGISFKVKVNSYLKKRRTDFEQQKGERRRKVLYLQSQYFMCG